jgi:hypothetical protein
VAAASWEPLPQQGSIGRDSDFSELPNGVPHPYRKILNLTDLMICTSKNLKSNRSHGARNLVAICLPLARGSGMANLGFLKNTSQQISSLAVVDAR